MDVTVELDDVRLPGYLSVPDGDGALVVFAHGSGSSRDSPRNQQVAAGLNEAGFATLLFDLLEPSEARDRANVFDIPNLAQRLIGATDWASTRDELRGSPIGLFGASTGAAAALEAAARRPERVGAVVSRGGRPDLATTLAEVTQPVLLIVGGNDPAVLEMNRDAGRRIADCELEVVPGAGHLFEGPGELEQVTDHAIRWFRRL